MSTLNVPTATPDDLTYRIGWEVVAIDAKQVTVRLRRIAACEDSDGIPVAVEHEVSLRGVVETDQHTGQLAAKLSPQEKVRVLMTVCDLSARTLDKDNVAYTDCIDTPILVPDGKVHWLATKRIRFTKWFLSMRDLEFHEVDTLLYLRGAGTALRASAQAWLRQIAELLPEFRQFDDRLDLFMEDL
jgi:hypothetical protein